MIPKKYLRQTRQINWIFFKLYKEFIQFYEKSRQVTKEKWQMTQKEQLELVNKYIRVHTLLSEYIFCLQTHSPKMSHLALKLTFSGLCSKVTSQSFLWFSSVAQSCPTLRSPMNRSTPGLPVHHHLPEFTQTHIHRVSDAIQPSRSSPSPPAPNPSQHQSLFQWVNSLHHKYLFTSEPHILFCSIYLPGTVNSLCTVSSSCKNPALCGQEFYSHSLPYSQCLEQYLVCSQNLYILAEWMKDPNLLIIGKLIKQFFLTILEKKRRKEEREGGMK